MPNIQHVPNSPNPKAATFILDKDILGPFGKIFIGQKSKLIAYAPLAEELYARGTDLVRIDLFNRPEGGTGITFSRKVLPWTGDQIATFQKVLIEFFSRPRPAIMVEALAKSIEAQQPFNHENKPVKRLVQNAFNLQVNPVLAKDGGAMELVNVELRQNGEVYADVVMIGSCNGCDSAQTRTLSGAGKRINEAFDEVKNNEKYKNNPAIQALNFKEIRVIELPELVLARAA